MCDDGEFRIEGVPNGRWIADAFAPGYSSPGGVELDAGKGVPELALVRGGAIEGRVLDGDGHPVAGASVRALTAGPTPTEISAQVDADKLRRFSGRTAAPVADATQPFADPQFLARGELGVMLGPIPPIPPPGAEVARPAAVVDPASPAGALAGDPAPLAVDASRASIWMTGADGRYRILGLPNRPVLVLAFSIFCVIVELFLNSTGYFHWHYWWWDRPNVILIVLLGYVPFFAMAAWVFDMGVNRRRQLRVVGAILAVDVVFGVALGVAGWL